MSETSKQKPDAAMPLTVEVEGDVLCIRIGVGLLAFSVQGADSWPATLSIRDASDVHAFAEAIASELRSEDEDGTTPVDRMLDAAAQGVIERGDESVVERPVEHGISLATRLMRGGDA